MAVYTVHEPSRHSADALADAERCVFVRDGFSWWAFLLAPLWMLWHRMWLVLLAYIALAAVLDAGLAALGASSAAITFVGLLLALLVGLEASTLRRFTLRRRGWQSVGVVSGEDLEDAERRFFDAWLWQPRGQPGGSSSSQSKPPPLPPPPPSPPAPQAPDVIGLFPQPGVSR